MSQSGVLLVNLGSPDSTRVGDVRRYLREFLMDPRVIDTSWPARFFVVHACILPFRPKQSAEAYEAIWTPEGSPLIEISKKVLELLRQRVDVPAELAMRYQNPSIESGIRRLRERGVNDLFLIPLFPHYAMSSYETAVERVKEAAREIAPEMKVAVQPPYYADEDFIHALVQSASPYLKEDYDHLLFSFHGVPERQVKKTDPTGAHCLLKDRCCDTPSEAHAYCYRHQCFQTVRAFAEKAGLSPEKYSVSFQSRLGRDPWLKPYTDFEIERFAKEGKKKLLVICPAFVSDCLETLEEIGIRARETFQAAGGEELIRIPCLNDHPDWIGVLERMTGDYLKRGV